MDPYLIFEGFKLIFFFAEIIKSMLHQKKKKAFENVLKDLDKRLNQLETKLK